MPGLTIADRIKNVLTHKKVSISSIARTDTERVNITRQLNSQVKVSMETINHILELFPDISAEWLMRGEGTMERTKIVTAPNRQDIHLAEGATAAISQSGEAKIESPKDKDEKEEPTEIFTPSDLARMMREQDVAGLVSIILQQKDEIIRIQREHITSMRAEMQFVDKTIFPPVK